MKFNFTNYREIADKKRILFSGDNVILYSGLFNTSSSYAALETIWQRATYSDKNILKIIAARKFQNLSHSRKIRILKNELERFFVKQDIETIKNIKTPYKYNIFD